MAGYRNGGSGTIPGQGGGVVNWVSLTASDVTGSEDPNNFANGAISQVGDFIRIPVSTNIVGVNLNSTYNLQFGLPAAFALDGTKPQMLLTDVTFENLPANQWMAALGLRDPLDTPVGLAAGLLKGSTNMIPAAARATNLAQGTALTTTSLRSFGVVSMLGNRNDVAIVDNSAMSILEEGGTARSACNTNSGAIALKARTNLILAIGHNSGVLHTETLGVFARYAVIDL